MRYVHYIGWSILKGESNMNKKVRIIMIIGIILILLVPIATYATKKMMQVHYITEEEIKKSEDIERERLLKEKAQFAEEHKNDLVTMENKEENRNITEEEVEFNKRINEGTEKIKLMDEVLRRTDNEKATRIFKAVEEDNKGLQPLNKPLKDIDYEYYDFVMDTYENENLTQEEREAFKYCLNSLYYEIKTDENLKARADKIIK